MIFQEPIQLYFGWYYTHNVQILFQMLLKNTSASWVTGNSGGPQISATSPPRYDIPPLDRFSLSPRLEETLHDGRWQQGPRSLSFILLRVPLHSSDTGDYRPISGVWGDLPAWVAPLVVCRVVACGDFSRLGNLVWLAIFYLPRQWSVVRFGVGTCCCRIRRDGGWCGPF
jgi:hypothetical protein